MCEISFFKWVKSIFKTSEFIFWTLGHQSFETSEICYFLNDWNNFFEMCEINIFEMYGIFFHTSEICIWKLLIWFVSNVWTRFIEMSEIIFWTYVKSIFLNSFEIYSRYVLVQRSLCDEFKYVKKFQNWFSRFKIYDQFRMVWEK